MNFGVGMDISISHCDIQNDFRKLQEKVKKLELQNEQLRDQKCDYTYVNGDVDQSVNMKKRYSAEFVMDICSEGSFGDLDILDIDNLSLKGDDDSWLYSSPKLPTSQQSKVDLHKWMRQDFDCHSSRVELARHSLIHKLDEAAHLNHSSNTPILVPSSNISSVVINNLTDQPQHGNMRAFRKKSVSLESAVCQANGTFNCSKNIKSMCENVHSSSLRMTSDVEAVARQQEESLRQSLSSYTALKRDDRPVSFSSDGGTRSNLEGLRHRSSTNESDATIGPHSILNRSINLPLSYRERHAMHCSDSSLERHPHHLSSGDVTQRRDSLPSFKQACTVTNDACRSLSPSLRAVPPFSATAVVEQGGCGGSLHRSGLPVPRRSIPRPSAGNARLSAYSSRSGIPSRQPSSKRADESWRDGCF